jgi:hypothetical protein
MWGQFICAMQCVATAVVPLTSTVVPARSSSSNPGQHVANFSVIYLGTGPALSIKAVDLVSGVAL